MLDVGSGAPTVPLLQQMPMFVCLPCPCHHVCTAAAPVADGCRYHICDNCVAAAAASALCTGTSAAAATAAMPAVWGPEVHALTLAASQLPVLDAAAGSGYLAAAMGLMVGDEGELWAASASASWD